MQTFTIINEDMMNCRITILEVFSLYCNWPTILLIKGTSEITAPIKLLISIPNYKIYLDFT